MWYGCIVWYIYGYTLVVVPHHNECNVSMCWPASGVLEFELRWGAACVFATWTLLNTEKLNTYNHNNFRPTGRFGGSELQSHFGSD